MGMPEFVRQAVKRESGPGDPILEAGIWSEGSPWRTVPLTSEHLGTRWPYDIYIQSLSPSSPPH